MSVLGIEYPRIFKHLVKQDVPLLCMPKTKAAVLPFSLGFAIDTVATYYNFFRSIELNASKRKTQPDIFTVGLKCKVSLYSNG